MPLRIRQLKLKRIRQFRDVTFDFTDPAPGKPLDRICLIGGNGTGKSTILRLLASQNVLGTTPATMRWARKVSSEAQMTVDFINGESRACLFGPPNQLKWGTTESPLASVMDGEASPVLLRDTAEHKQWVETLRDLVTVYCPPDSELNPKSAVINDVPASNLNSALSFLKNPSKKFEAVG